MKNKGVDKILLTGGAGFIGSHTTDLLLKHGYHVSVLDNLEPQVHGRTKKLPDYINSDATFIHGDIRDRVLLDDLIPDVDAVIHLAAMVGVTQSMYKIQQYVDVNAQGTANLLDVLANEEHKVRKLIIASSNTIYGEGKYYCETCSIAVYPSLRNDQQMRAMQWAQLCSVCGSPLIPISTDEEKPAYPTTIYAMTKRLQEEMCLLTGKTYGIPTVALRYFNVYGSRQALTNPYTGVLSSFISRIRSIKPPLIFEDGNQTRDFTHVTDIVNANLFALETSQTDYGVFNIGTGTATSIFQIANTLIELFGVQLIPDIIKKHRTGDIRHCYADISKIQKIGFNPRVGLFDGLKETINWAYGQESVEDNAESAIKELREHGLLR